MASDALTEMSVRESAAAYLAALHPALAGCELAVLRLGPGWLVEALSTGDGWAPERALLLVRGPGLVEEIGRALPRHVARRLLARLPSGPTSDHPSYDPGRARWGGAVA